ncbi:MAG TPA: xanthine dehydrogenase family protein subunit M [Polyangiaceae bacterium]
MRGDLGDFELVTARSLGDACDRVAEGYRPLAGGTDVMVLLSSGKLTHGKWVDLWAVEELRQVRADEARFEMGALTTYTGVRRHPLLSRELPMLAQAASETGGIAIQNRGTLGGNIGNASPAADSPPALLAYGAEVVLASRRGERTVPYATFHTAYKRTVAAPDELVARIVVPRGEARRADRVHYYRKVGPRRAQAISKVCFAACADRDGARVRDVKIALGGVAPVPVRALEAEQAIVAGEPFERVSEALGRAITPIDDVRSNAAYRRRVADNLLRDFLRHVAVR